MFISISILIFIGIGVEFYYFFEFGNNYSLIFLTLFFFLSKTIGNNDYPIAQKIKSFVPKTIKETLKNSVFIFPLSAS